MKDNRKKARILLVDDEDHILELYRYILTEDCETNGAAGRIDELEKNLFGNEANPFKIDDFALTVCHQGDEAVQAVKIADQENDPYAIAFLDIRMPPGPDGLWTAEQIRKIDPYVIVVLVTAYADVTANDVYLKVPPPGRLLYVQKPLLHLEIQQIAMTMAEKWRMEKRLIELGEIV
ncbi:MAG: hypothetical protein KKG47_07750 [Proteobacteria bacterium]|nr:hypothetical protein [Pseudomonadota bacterium]MBU1739361.1 hypothetical protein [Pseudomonadota bacterium]